MREAPSRAKAQVGRRLATILATDAVGYSRLMRADEEGTVATLHANRSVIDDLIARHSGRIFGSAGDSVIAEFGSEAEARAKAQALALRAIADRLENGEPLPKEIADVFAAA